MENKKLQSITKKANDLIKNYTFDKYCELYDMCAEAGLFWSEKTDGDTFEFWIEDSHWICKD